MKFYDRTVGVCLCRTFLMLHISFYQKALTPTKSRLVRTLLLFTSFYRIVEIFLIENPYFISFPKKNSISPSYLLDEHLIHLRRKRLWFKACTFPIITQPMENISMRRLHSSLSFSARQAHAFSR